MFTLQMWCVAGEKCYNERERELSQTVQAIVTRTLYHPSDLKRRRKQLHPPLPGQKEEEWWKKYKDAINTVNTPLSILVQLKHVNHDLYY